MDPNFPPSLNISPLAPIGVQYESTNQKEAIEKYGIAGRVWEATRPLVQYFTPTSQATYDPPCPIFDVPSPRKIVELGSGQGLASLHLANHLEKADRLVLTDLENVIPLCQLSIDNWEGTRDDVPEVHARALGWGNDSSQVRALGPFDYILMCDLVRLSSLGVRMNTENIDILSKPLSPTSADTPRIDRTNRSYLIIKRYFRSHNNIVLYVHVTLLPSQP